MTILEEYNYLYKKAVEKERREERRNSKNKVKTISNEEKVNKQTIVVIRESNSLIVCPVCNGERDLIVCTGRIQSGVTWAYKPCTCCKGTGTVFSF